MQRDIASELMNLINLNRVNGSENERAQCARLMLDASEYIQSLEDTLARSIEAMNQGTVALRQAQTILTELDVHMCSVQVVLAAVRPYVEDPQLLDLLDTLINSGKKKYDA